LRYDFGFLRNHLKLTRFAGHAAAAVDEAAGVAASQVPRHFSVIRAMRSVARIALSELTLPKLTLSI
jgi:hypothetical protein